MTAPSPARVHEHVPPDSTPEEIDRALAELRAKADEWPRVSLADRRAILRETIRDFRAVSDEWADLCRRAEGIPAGRPQAGEEWLAGPYLVIRNLRLLEQSLADIERLGHPRIPGKVQQRPDGRVTAEVFPASIYDRIFYSGVTAEVWMQPGVTVDSLTDTMALAYKNPPEKGEVSLVLGAGNVSSIGPMDLLYKLFVENQVAVCKMHPVNAYLGPLIERGFQALVDWGVLRIVYGGVDVGELLCNHDEVDEIHITGSDKTVEAIVFGTGEEGEKRKAEKRPRNSRPISSELGNVSPVIVVPGPWNKADLAYQGENIASMLANNAGFNCNAARVLIQHESWQHRQTLLDEVRTSFREIPTRHAYYPGAFERWQRFVDAHPEAERLGSPAEGELPWTLIPDVEPTADEITVQSEAFCAVMAETALEAATPAEFLDRAVELCNDTVWGTLNATLIVHPASLVDLDTRAAFDRALADLRYGTVAVNCWAAVGYGLVTTPWGAFPGHDLYDIQSGTGVVHNTLMFDRVEKAVVTTPFRMIPKPPWFAGHKTGLTMGKKITDFEASPSVLKLPGIFWDALRG